MKKKLKKIQESSSTRLISEAEIKHPFYKVMYVLIVLFLIGMCMITVLPTVWIFASSLKDAKEFNQIPPTIIPRSFHPEKVLELWKTLKFVKYLKNSAIIIIGDLVCTILFNGMAGYVFSKLKPAGHKILYKIVFITMLLPTSMNMIPLFSQFVDFPYLGINLTGTFFPMWMMACFSAFNIMLFKNFFDTIPQSIVEAARIDGQSEIGIFLKMIIPLSKPIIMVVSIFTVVAAWGNFMWPFLILKDPNTQPVSVMLFSQQSLLPADQYMTLMMLSIIPPLVVFFCFSKQIMGGLVIGGVKE